MTFNFDGGDILVILLVVVAFILFRRFDRTGRSLEKVRRYADKSKAELDAIVRERELGLKDLSVDLEVQEQTNREILNRADAAREEILSRAEDLEERVEKIEAHERALEDLNELALRVDENLSRLRDESDYVDQVGSRLSEVRDRFASFAEKDADRFAAFREESLARFAAELQRIESGMEETGRGLDLFRENLEGLNAQRDESANEKLSAYRDDLERIEEDFRNRLRKVAEEGTRLEDDAFTALNEKIDTRTERLESNWMGGMNELKDQVALTAEEIQDRLAEARESMDRLSGEYQESEERLTELNRTVDERLTGTYQEVEERLTGRFSEVEDRLSGNYQALEERLTGGFSEVEGRLTENYQEVEERLTGEFRDVEERLSETATTFGRSIDELRDRVEKIVESKETDLLESFEIRQSDYRKTVEERFARIEGFIGDMDALAESLKTSQEQTIRDIDEGFRTFDAEMTERRDLEKARIQEEAAVLQQDMADLERGLDELKSRAYDNVSEKLQVFEDEFFADLKSRDEQMRAAMNEWRKNVELELAELGQKAGREREESERRYSTELKQKLTDLQTRVYGQFETFQDQVDGFRESLNNRIRSAEDEFGGFRDEFAERIARDRDAVSAEFEKTYDAFDAEVNDKFAKANKVIGAKLSDFTADIDARHRELTGDFQSARDEIAEWKDRLGVQVDEASRTTLESIETMKADFASHMSELQDEYAGKTEQLVLESGEERAALRREIGLQEEAVTKLATDLTEKSRDSLDTLKDLSEGFLLEFRKNSREARDEVERKIKELRQSVQESRERSEANRKEMAAHTDTEYARLMRNLDEIDKRQREFISETRVFERADEMKEALETDIAELSRQMDQVGAGREEIRAINERYEKAISLYDDVNAKLSRFLAEQQKVENLEGKIARIGSLSESVDLKLDRVTDANDTLQDLQVRLKQLEDLHEDLGGRYERLSEKSSVLDAATDGVDKNFERMTRIEEILRDIAERIIPLREDVEAAEERQARLEEDREKIDQVAGKAASIDSTLAELDKRLEDLGKAREWLARTETRLEEINADTQQKVRLLGTLAKREGGGRKTQGSPDMSTREVVVKLAREGWNSEEIARTTKLSRGEVELILELTPNE